MPGRARMLLAIIDDIVLLALAVAVAAVVLICILLGLYVWFLRRQGEQDERRVRPVEDESHRREGEDGAGEGQ